MKTLFIIIALLPALLAHSQRWGLPTQDSSCSVISYGSNRQINSRHATIVYTKTLSAANLDRGNIQGYRSVTTITLTTGDESVTYAVSSPTMSVITRAPGSGQAILANDVSGKLMATNVGDSGPVAVVPGSLATYSVVPLQSLTFSITPAARNTIGKTGAKGQVPAQFSHGSLHSCMLNYEMDKNDDTVMFSMPLTYFPLSSPASTLAVQSSSASPVSTVALVAMTNPSFQLAVNAVSYYNTSVPNATLTLTKQERRNLYENFLFRAKRNAGIFYLSSGFMPSLLSRQVLVNSTTYRNNAFINQTKYNESPSYDVDVFGKMGIRLRRKAILFVEVTYGARGFRADYDSIRPFSGVSDASIPSKEYKAYVLNLGVGYSYNWYIPGRFVNPVVEAGLYASRDQNTIDVSSNINHTRTGIKLGAGIALKPNIRHDIKIMPTFCYDFTAVAKNDVSTRFYAFGLCLSYGIALFNYGAK